MVYHLRLAPVLAGSIRKSHLVVPLPLHELCHIDVQNDMVMMLGIVIGGTHVTLKLLIREQADLAGSIKRGLALKRLWLAVACGDPEYFFKPHGYNGWSWCPPNQQTTNNY